MNKGATCLQNLIIWDPIKTNEPVLTQQLPEEDLKKIVQTPMEVGRYPVHGQRVERCVREMTAPRKPCSDNTYRRDGFVMAWLAHREKTEGAVKSNNDHAMICT